MEADVSKLIPEFVSRKPTCDSLLCCLVQKTALLRKIQLETHNGSVSEHILELLEIIEELNYKEEVSVLDSMKDAYCAVAVECTVKFLVENATTDGKYFDAVKRIWRGKIHEMENSPMVGLVSEQLLEWWDDVETARWNRRVREDILARNTRNDALRLVQAYVAEAWAVTVSPFLDMVAQPTKPVKESPGAAATSPDVATGLVVPNQNKGRFFNLPCNFLFVFCI